MAEHLTQPRTLMRPLSGHPDREGLARQRRADARAAHSCCSTVLCAKRSFSRLLTLRRPRASCSVSAPRRASFNPSGLPLPDDAPKRIIPRSQELRELVDVVGRHGLVLARAPRRDDRRS